MHRSTAHGRWTELRNLPVPRSQGRIASMQTTEKKYLANEVYSRGVIWRSDLNRSQIEEANFP